MKIALAIFLLLILSHSSFSQEGEKQWFDFWVGKWNATWTEPGGKTGRGTNHVVKILDSTVIQENFAIQEGASQGYLGTSLSVYNPKGKMWHQAYADNQGAYFNFIGERDGARKIFKTELVVKDGKSIIKRMVFYNITPDAFTWDWESTEDGGKTWTLNWRINYIRQRE